LKNLFLVILLVLTFGRCKKDPDKIKPIRVETVAIIKGVDASYLPQIRKSKVVTFNREGQPEDMLLTFKNEGINTIRLRLWKEAANGESGLAEVAALANEIKALGMKVWLTIHYSDTWADPGSQIKPKQWGNADFVALKDSVYAYTALVVSTIAPDYIQIGNEINNGFIYPEGSRNYLNQMKDLINQGIKATREANPKTKIMIHFAGTENASAFFGSVSELDFDLIALSYYPQWHGKDLVKLSSEMESLSKQINKPVVIAETSYPFTFNWNDQTHNVLGLQEQILNEYPPSAQGQLDYLKEIRRISTSSKSALGFCYWGAEWIAFRGKNATDGSSWENQALWDFNNKALPVFDAFH
jgi:arabinogalactan endo-1,4-beta-galactosidase